MAKNGVRARRGRDLGVIAPNLSFRLSGVTSTISTLVPIQARQVPIAALGLGLPPRVPRTSLVSVLRDGYSRPPGRPFRIWHARRNNEMLVGLLLKRVLRQPFRLVFTSAAQRRHTRWTKFLLRQMDAVIATSPFAANSLEVPHQVILHGVDANRFRPPMDKGAAWKATGLPGRYGIGVTGRIRHQKGTDLFVEAMCRLLPTHPDWTAVILGRVTSSNRGFADSLKRRIAEAGLAGRVLFLGEVPEAELPRWYAAMSIFVGPQREEGFGLTPLEAMASEAPVVAARVGAFPLTIVEGVTGFLVDPGDVLGLEQRIWRLMEDPALRSAMGKAGRAHVAENHPAEGEAQQIVGVYERLWAAG